MVAWVRSVKPACIVPLGQVGFQKFQTGIFVEWKAPFSFLKCRIDAPWSEWSWIMNGRFYTKDAPSVKTKKKRHFIWVSTYLARKHYLGTLFFTSPTGDGTAILRGQPSHAKVQPLRQYLQFSVIFKTLSIGPVLGIEPATSRSAVKRSTDWAKAAAVTWANTL